MENRHAVQAYFTQNTINRSEYLVFRTREKEAWKDEYYNSNATFASALFGATDKESFFAGLDSVFSGSEAMLEFLLFSSTSFTIISSTPFTYETDTGSYNSKDMVDLYRQLSPEETSQYTDEQIREMMEEEGIKNVNYASIELADHEFDVKCKGVTRPSGFTLPLPLMTTSLSALFLIEMSGYYSYKAVGMCDVKSFESSQDYGTVYDDEESELVAQGVFIPMSYDIRNVLSFEGLDGTSNVSGLFGTYGLDSATIRGPVMSIPTGGFEYLMNVTKCKAMFCGCSGIISNIELLYRYLSTKRVPVTEHEACFQGCLLAQGFNSVPGDWGGMYRGKVHVKYTGADPTLDLSGMSKQELHEVFKDKAFTGAVMVSVSCSSGLGSFNYVKLNGREYLPHEKETDSGAYRYMYFTNNEEYKNYYEAQYSVEVELVDDTTFDIEYAYESAYFGSVPVPRINQFGSYNVCEQIFEYPSLSTFSNNCLYLYLVIESLEIFKNTRTINMGDIRILWIPETGYENLAKITDCTYAMGWSNGNTSVQPLKNDIYSLYQYLSTKPVEVTSFTDTFKYCTRAYGWEEVPLEWGGGKLLPTSQFTEVEYYGDDTIDVVVTSNSNSGHILFKNMQYVGANGAQTVSVSKGDKLQLKGYYGAYYYYSTPILSTTASVSGGVFDVKKFEKRSYGTGAQFRFCKLIGKVSSWEGMCGDLDNMFMGCSNLVSVPGDMSALQSTEDCMLDSAMCMFYGCVNLETSITAWPVFKHDRHVDVRAMFFECRKLKSVAPFDVSTMTRYAMVNMLRLFYGCRKLEIDAKAFYDNVAPYTYSEPRMMFYDCTSCVNYASLPDNMIGVRIGNSRYPYMATSTSCDRELWITENFHEVLGTLGTDCRWCDNDPTNENRKGMVYSASAFLDVTSFPTTAGSSKEAEMSQELKDLIGGSGWKVPQVGYFLHIGDLNVKYFNNHKSAMVWRPRDGYDCSAGEFDARPSPGLSQISFASSTVKKPSSSSSSNYMEYGYAYATESSNEIRSSGIVSTTPSTQPGVLRLFQQNVIYVSVTYGNGDDYESFRYMSGVAMVDGWTRTIPIKWAPGYSASMYNIQQPSGSSITARFDADGNIVVSNVSSSTTSRTSLTLTLTRKDS